MGSSSLPCAKCPEEELTEEKLSLVFTNLVPAGGPPSVDVSVLLHSVQVCPQ